MSETKGIGWGTSPYVRDNATTEVTKLNIHVYTPTECSNPNVHVYTPTECSNPNVHVYTPTECSNPNVYFNTPSEALNQIEKEKMENKDWTKINNCVTISSKLKENEESNMSAIVMFYDKNLGVVMASDSRETYFCGYSDNKQKIYQNENIIVGQLGLNSIIIDGQKVEFGRLIVDELLKGNSIDDAINQDVFGKRLIDVLPENKPVTIFYARKNGEVGVYDIKKGTKLNNLVPPNDNGVFRNIPNFLLDIYNNYFIPTFMENFYYESIEDLEKILSSVVESLIYLEQKREKIFHIKSAIGGKVQVASIKFDFCFN